jgi:hypothetical protein
MLLSPEQSAKTENQASMKGTTGRYTRNAWKEPEWMEAGEELVTK